MVLESSVVGLPDDRWGEVVVAVMRLTAGAEDKPKSDFIDFVSARLAPFKVPARWFVADEFPVTPTGKVRKFELRDAILHGQLREL
jgi:fatty-acyl-CoA synthase/long-chain acyl-CoA synthetase